MRMQVKPGRQNNCCRVAVVWSVVIALTAGMSWGQGAWTLRITKDTKGLHLPIGNGSLQVRPAHEDYADMLMQVCKSMGLNVTRGECQIFPLTTAQLSAGALATVADGNDVIIYDTTLSSRIGYAGAVGVMGHELGHHYCRHLSKPPLPKHELEADRFAGAAMRRAGYSLAEALAMSSILNSRPSTTHPGRDDRQRVIAEGWNEPESAKSCR